MDMTDVLIAGAGPTGLMLAATLARHGIRPRIVDPVVERDTRSKALAIHARTLEIFEAMGIVGPFLERGVRLERVEVRNGARTLVRLANVELDSPYPFVLVLPQHETEAILEEHLAGLGVEVERGLELRGFIAEPDRVVCRLAGRDEERTRAAVRWLVGCDGAYSTVRELMGVSLSGDDIPGCFTLADVALETELPRDEFTVQFHDDGPLIAIPLPTADSWRIIAACSDDTELPGDLAGVQALLDRRLHRSARVQSIEWLSDFEVHQRKVSSYRVGRVFLAGDAAHAHSPVGGQGMNTGIQDAWNLGWKLALVAQGVGHSILLDSYHLEREPIATTLLRNTARATRVVTVRSPLARSLRNQFARVLGSLEVVQQRMARTLGETGIHYRQSAIVAEDRSTLGNTTVTAERDTELPSIGDWRDFGAAPHAGDRAPDAFYGLEGDKHRLFELLGTARHTLLIFDGEADTDAGYDTLSEIAGWVSDRYGPELIRTHVVVPATETPRALSWQGSVLLDPDFELHDRYGAAAECLYVIRPDGYIGYRCQPANAESLAAWFEGIFTC